jgi:hypothetical protein
MNIRNTEEKHNKRFMGKVTGVLERGAIANAYRIAKEKEETLAFMTFYQRYLRGTDPNVLRLVRQENKKLQNKKAAVIKENQKLWGAAS